MKIVAISCDKSFEKSRKIVYENQRWKNIEQLHIWKSTVLKNWDISKLPYSILVDAQGIIIQNNQTDLINFEKNINILLEDKNQQLDKEEQKLDFEPKISVGDFCVPKDYKILDFD